MIVGSAGPPRASALRSSIPWPTARPPSDPSPCPTPPVAFLSWKSRVCATDQPSFSCPIRFSNGIDTSSKNSWQNSDSPSACRIGSMVTPGALSGTANIDRPRCLGTSQFVLARHIPTSAVAAPVLQILDPLSTQLSPSRSALVTAPAKSDPPPGSESNWIHTSCPRIIRGR